MDRFLRIPLGYTLLYAVCTLVGAAAAPNSDSHDVARGHRWLSATLFGESIGGVFERGISQYPTIDDEVHLVTTQDMQVIYRSVEVERAVTVGQVAAASGIPGSLDLGTTRNKALRSSGLYGFRQVKPISSTTRSNSKTGLSGGTRVGD